MNRPTEEMKQVLRVRQLIRTKGFVVAASDIEENGYTVVSQAYLLRLEQAAAAARAFVAGEIDQPRLQEELTD